MPKLRVGVLMGGKSIEREVSFNTGRTVCDHLDSARYNIIPIFQTISGELYLLPWHFLHRGKITDFLHRLAQEATAITWDNLSHHIDFAFIAMHGRYAEDGILQGTLELLGIPYLGSNVWVSSLCMDKIRIKPFLTEHKIATPLHIEVTPDQGVNPEKHISALVEKLHTASIQFPLIVKPSHEGSSLGISLVFSPDDLSAAITKACLTHPEKPQTVLLEERITGMEFSCVTLVNYKNKTLMPLPPTEIVHESQSDYFDYKQKYMPGRALKFTPPRCSTAITEKIQNTCGAVMKLLEIETISRIDGFVKKDGTVCIVDVNTFSGMAPSSFVFREAAEIGMSHTDLINHLIETDLDRYDMLDALTTAEDKETKTMNHKKLRVGVLMGGPSHEREISLESGRNVTFKLSPHKYQTTPLFVDTDMSISAISQVQLVRNSTKEISNSLTPDQRLQWHDLKQSFDFIFIALHGGPGENGTVQGMLEMLAIPYNGSSVFASALCMDKYKTAHYLGALGFNVPQSNLISHKNWQENQQEIISKCHQSIGFPCIIKPHDDGCSVMVYKANNAQELQIHISSLFTQHKTHALVEQFIQGMELTVGVVGNDKAHALPPSQTIATKGILSIEEKFLPGAGENQTPATLPAHILSFVQETMELVYEAVGCKGYARIDCFYQNATQSPTHTDRVVILEINSLPGLTPATCIFHQAAEIGIKPMDFIDIIIQYGLAEHTKATEPSLATYNTEHVRIKPHTTEL
jgi:D-alanine-D-alanine ligase and related ATP-grasp enzymes